MVIDHGRGSAAPPSKSRLARPFPVSRLLAHTPPRRDLSRTPLRRASKAVENDDQAKILSPIPIAHRQSRLTPDPSGHTPNRRVSMAERPSFTTPRTNIRTSQGLHDTNKDASHPSTGSVIPQPRRVSFVRRSELTPTADPAGTTPKRTSNIAGPSKQHTPLSRRRPLDTRPDRLIPAPSRVSGPLTPIRKQPRIANPASESLTPASRTQPATSSLMDEMHVKPDRSTMRNPSVATRPIRSPIISRTPTAARSQPTVGNLARTPTGSRTPTSRRTPTTKRTALTARTPTAGRLSTSGRTPIAGRTPVTARNPVIAQVSGSARTPSDTTPKSDLRAPKKGFTPSRMRTPTVLRKSIVTRPALQESPYTRRASSGLANARTPVASVSRKLNMVPAEDENQAAAPVALAMRPSTAVTSDRSGKATRAPDRPIGVEERRVSGTGASRSRNPSNAVESFRGFRRASLESTTDAEEPTEPSVTMENALDRGPMPSSAVDSLRASRRGSLDYDTAESGPGTPTLTAVESTLDQVALATAAIKSLREQRRNSLSIEEAHDIPDRSIPTNIYAAPTQSPVPYNTSTGMGNVQTQLPDRSDPIVPSMSSALATPSRKSSRFSDANVNLSNVERLRTSLGRRRSVDVHSAHLPETPRLRRSILGTEEDNESFAQKMAEMGVSNQASSERTPLRSIVSNQNSVSKRNKESIRFSSKTNTPMESRSRMSSRLAKLDDDDLDLGNEEVEDLGHQW